MNAWPAHGLGMLGSYQERPGNRGQTPCDGRPHYPWTAHMRSKIAAMPWPPPMHMVTKA